MWFWDNTKKKQIFIHTLKIQKKSEEAKEVQILLQDRRENSPNIGKDTDMQVKEGLYSQLCITWLKISSIKDKDS